MPKVGSEPGSKRESDDVSSSESKFGGGGSPSARAAHGGAGGGGRGAADAARDTAGRERPNRDTGGAAGGSTPILPGSEQRSGAAGADGGKSSDDGRNHGASFASWDRDSRAPSSRHAADVTIGMNGDGAKKGGSSNGGGAGESKRAGAGAPRCRTLERRGTGSPTKLQWLLGDDVDDASALRLLKPQQFLGVSKEDINRGGPKLSLKLRAVLGVSDEEELARGVRDEVEAGATYVARAPSPDPPVVHTTDETPCTGKLNWLVACLFFAYAFFQRVAPSVMTDKLAASFDLTAGEIGLLSGTYFYAYAVAQVPCGLLVDRFGVRPALVCGGVLTAVGSLVFATAESTSGAAIGRVCVGLGVAPSWIMVLVLSVQLFPTRLAAVTGLGVFAGLIGAQVAQAPLAAAIEASPSWRHVMQWVAVVPGIVVLVVLALACAEARRAARQHRSRPDTQALVASANDEGGAAVAPHGADTEADSAEVDVAACADDDGDDVESSMHEGFAVPGLVQRRTRSASSDIGIAADLAAPIASASVSDQPGGERPRQSLLATLLAVVADKNNRLIVAFAVCNVATLLAFASLWGPAYFATVRGWEREKASWVSSAFLWGWGAGAPLSGMITDWYRGDMRVLLAVAGVCGSAMMSAALWSDPGAAGVFVLLVLAGLCTPLSMIFTAIHRINGSEQAGTAAAVLNATMMGAAALLQAAVGELLEALSDASTKAAGEGGSSSGADGDAPIYTVEAFRKAVAVFPALFFCSAVFAVFMRPVLPFTMA